MHIREKCVKYSGRAGLLGMLFTQGIHIFSPEEIYGMGRVPHTVSEEMRGCSHLLFTQRSRV